MTARPLGQRDLDRRDFHKLTAAALGGLAAGSVLGCGGNKPATPAANPPAAPGPTAVAAVEKHLRVEGMAGHLAALDDRFAALPTFDAVSIEAALRSLAEECHDDSQRPSPPSAQTASEIDVTHGSGAGCL